ncbi:MAG: bi-domain-containing oxidoreductase [Gemmatimonadota bacterium]
MKQVIQELDTGAIRLVDVPAPLVRPGGVLVRTLHSVISIGTERSKIELGRKSLLGKARERPDQVRKVIDTIKREGLASAYRKVRSRLSAPSPLGYSCAGVVEAVGAGVDDIEVGQLVACAGAGYANHAERVWVPKNLVVPVPEGVPSDHAAFATLGAIALQGVRQAEVRLGETVAVIGLGILGQLTVQLLRAAGAQPIGIDVDAGRVKLAERHGAVGVLRSDDVAGRVAVLSGGIGADAVIITAATSSEDPIRLAGEIARDRARVVVVGAVPIHAPRSPYYEKELEIRLSRSYGPGRYDPDYEEKGHDYPVGYVRWTERRNLAEFLRLVSIGAVRLDELITHRFPFAEVERAYGVLTGEEGRAALGVVLEYPEEAAEEPRRIVVRGERGVQGGRLAGAGDVVSSDAVARGVAAGASAVSRAPITGPIGVGLIGAGNFAQDVLIPSLKRLGVEFRGVVTASGYTARGAAEKHGFAYAASSPDEVLADPGTHVVVIATRHDEHARLAAEALRAGKAVFVEKPLALDEASLDDVLSAASQGGPLLVGFNRRFAPATQFVRERLARIAGARVVQIRVNAGAIPPTSWVHDPEVGGGRLIGEGCHFIDLALYLIGSPAVEVSARGITGPDPAAALQDNVVVTLRCADGSVASILYTSKGNPRSGKERVEVFAGGVSAVIDDFRSAEVHGAKRERWKGRQDKGHRAELEAFLRAVREGATSPIPLAELENSSRATLRAARSLATGLPERLD